MDFYCMANPHWDGGRLCYLSSACSLLFGFLMKWRAVQSGLSADIGNHLLWIG
jgi:hypothetical protein